MIALHTRRLPTRTMPFRPTRSIGAAIAVLALATAACGGSSSSAVATVNGETIERSDIVALRTSYQDAVSAEGAGFRNDLSAMIVQTAMVEAARDQFGIEFTDADIEESVANPPARYRAAFEQIAADPEAGPGLAAANAVQILVSEAVAGRLVLDQFGGAEEILETAPQDVTQVCVRHILTDSEEAAQDVLDRLEAGEEFADLVTEVSLDTTSAGGLIAGGDGFCPIHITPLGPEFALAVAMAPIGEPTGPLASEVGYHVIVVEEVVVPTVEQLEADPGAYVDPNAGNALLTAWFNDAVRNADIDVASALGTWSEAGAGIEPPGGIGVPTPPEGGEVPTPPEGGEAPTGDTQPPPGDTPDS